jgi:hypothetical protein
MRAWQQGRLAPPWRAHLGLLLAGWGVFDVVEGLIDHQILGIHHVRDHFGGPIGWDLGFLAFGVVLIVVGFGPGCGGARRACRCVCSARGRVSVFGRWVEGVFVCMGVWGSAG